VSPLELSAREAYRQAGLRLGKSYRRAQREGTPVAWAEVDRLRAVQLARQKDLVNARCITSLHRAMGML
jgi:hypothetical protein